MLDPDRSHLCGSNTVIVQCDNRTNSVYDKPTTNNRIYCKRNNIDYLFYNFGYSYLPPYWWKVQLLLDISHKYDYICWMDTDAYVRDVDVTFDSFFDVDKLNILRIPLIKQAKVLAKSYNLGAVKHIPSMIYSQEDLNLLPPFFSNKFTFQAGVFLINTKYKGRDILQFWIDTYDPAEWKITTDPYSFQFIGDAVYAGKGYEQGNFKEYVKPAFYEDVCELPYCILNESNTRAPSAYSWSIHNYNKGHIGRYNYFLE